MATTMIGTPPYMSPEIFSHIPYGPKVCNLFMRMEELIYPYF